ncbi:hypothetical protein MO973_45590 [Paenibacillus sp. TRM 82003]|nr:hypothetical protein [Kineococcus sp. TRM81007]MCI2240354.1 hypothetical protein [Kineococcus sp. TRM81007]MCI3927469.1 hypothetical protein [Paenibacillus sp. TRM 82003]
MSTGPDENTRPRGEQDAVQESTDDLVDEALDTDDADAPSEPRGGTHIP